MINKLGFGFLRLPKKSDEPDWDAICDMVDVFMDGGGVCERKAWQSDSRR